ncbi:MAG: hypothetical protein ACLSE6_00835 [Alphaproteobacteria bacterium]
MKSSTDDKADYEFLDALVRKAALDGQPGIIFEDGMTRNLPTNWHCLCQIRTNEGQPET